MTVVDFQKTYKEKLVKELMASCDIKNAMEVPSLKKITLNMGLGEALNNKKVIASAVEEMRLISGQQPVVTLARKSVAGFKVREGWPIGCKVTLRGKNMYAFFERLVNVALPRVRDFRGLTADKSFDGRGNYNFGLTEQIVFPEIDYDKIDGIRGLDIAITTSTNDNRLAKALLKAFGFPFKG